MRELHNIEAEQAVLGSLLIDPPAIRKVRYFLEGDHFYRKKHAWIYDVMCDLREGGEALDVVTIGDELERRNLLEPIGGMAYLTELLNTVPSALHVEDYARRVATRSIDRRLKHVAEAIAKVAYQDDPPEEKLLMAREALEDIDIINARPEAMDARQAAEAMWDMAEEYANNPLDKNEVRGHSTGITDLDKMLRGFKTGLYLVGGVTHVGKTAFCLQLACNVAKDGGSVLFIETEDDEVAMWSRIYALESGFDRDDVERGLVGDDLTWYAEVLDRVQEWDFEVLAKGVSVGQVDMEVRSRDVDLVVVDNLESPALQYKGDANWLRFRGAAYGLLDVARDNKVPLITTMQVSRHELKRKKDKVPQIEDLYGADGPSQAASVVLTLHNEDVWNVGKDKDKTGILEVYCFKDKLAHKGVGKRVRLQFGEQGQVRNLARDPLEF